MNQLQKLRTKLGLDLVLGGFFIGAAICLRPYDFRNLVICGLGLIWLLDGLTTLRRIR